MEEMNPKIRLRLWYERPSDFTEISSLNQGLIQNPTLGLNVTEDEEAAAVAAMFKAQTENWEETQEKMSQWVPSIQLPNTSLCTHLTA